MNTLTKTGWIVNRNTKHIKATSKTAKQYLGDQITKNTTDPVDEILKHYEKPAQESVKSNHDRCKREDTYMNNNNDIQHSNIEEHIVNRITASCRQKENEKQIPIQ